MEGDIISVLAEYRGEIKPEELTEDIQNQLGQLRKYRAIVTSGNALGEVIQDEDVAISDDKETYIDLGALDGPTLRSMEPFLAGLRTLGDSAANEVFDGEETVSDVVLPVGADDIKNMVDEVATERDRLDTFLRPITAMANEYTLAVRDIGKEDSAVSKDILMKKLKFSRAVMTPLSASWLSTRGSKEGEEQTLENIKGIVESLIHVLPDEVIAGRHISYDQDTQARIRRDVVSELRNALAEFEGMVAYTHQKELEGYSVDARTSTVREDIAGVDFVAKLAKTDEAERVILGQVKSSVYYPEADDPLFFEANASELEAVAAQSRAAHDDGTYLDYVEAYVHNLALTDGDLLGDSVPKGHHVHVTQGITQAFSRFIRSEITGDHGHESEVAVIVVNTPDKLIPQSNG